ncbi:hypothetical protein ACFFX0_11055 [Citricoccus parietis]|uniref:Uncharacterized protein n=1 Tax=Citricoccus parietis TaxID=592307 RepID=A0ABV5FZP5_9MICC
MRSECHTFARLRSFSLNPPGAKKRPSAVQVDAGPSCAPAGLEAGQL